MLNYAKLESDIWSWAKDLFPVNRSLTGKGVRDSLYYMKSIHQSLDINEISSGTRVYDWTIPDEWDVAEAYIIDPSGKKICDFGENNLHLVGYSIAIDTELELQELQEHLYSLPDQPNAIPYVTSYYEPSWGFCIKHNDRLKLKEGRYRVKIKSRHFPGVLNYGELLIQGKLSKEVIFSSYICHPSMANNELSGPLVLLALARLLMKIPDLKYSYRFLFLPETIGAISYISKNYQHLKSFCEAGFVVTCVGDEGEFSYIPSRTGGNYADKVAMQALSDIAKEYTAYSWLDRGSDERQFCAPGIDLPFCSVTKSKYGKYREYHTSLDDLTFITSTGLMESVKFYEYVIKILEKNCIPKNKVMCEPFMSKYGLRSKLSSINTSLKFIDYTNVLSFCDGEHDLITIAMKVKLKFEQVALIIDELKKHELIECE